MTNSNRDDVVLPGYEVVDARDHDRPRWVACTETQAARLLRLRRVRGGDDGVSRDAVTG